MEDYVTFEQAKTLKELGFNWKCNHFYCQPEGKEVRLLCYIQRDYFDDQYHDFNDPTTWTIGAEISFSAPTLNQVQKWLREVKGVDITIGHVYHRLDSGDKIMYSLDIGVQSTFNTKFIRNYYSYNEALSVGIDHILPSLK